MVEASLRLTYSIGVIAALAFLGLSSDPNGANWGTMIQQNQVALAVQPWGALAADPRHRPAHRRHRARSATASRGPRQASTGNGDG